MKKDYGASIFSFTKEKPNEKIKIESIGF